MIRRRAGELEPDDIVPEEEPDDENGGAIAQKSEEVAAAAAREGGHQAPSAAAGAPGFNDFGAGPTPAIVSPVIVFIVRVPSCSSVL